MHYIALHSYSLHCITLLGSTGLYLQKEGTGRETDTDFDMKILTHRVRAEKKHMVNVVQFGHDTINACICVVSCLESIYMLSQFYLQDLFLASKSCSRICGEYATLLTDLI